MDAAKLPGAVERLEAIYVIKHKTNQLLRQSCCSDGLKHYLLDRCDSPILDRKGKFIYLAINKVCQQSIARHLLKDRVVVRKDNPEFHQQALTSMNELEVQSIFKFGIVRNPFDRFVSAVRYLQKIGKIESSVRFRDFVMAGDFADPHFAPQWPNLFNKGKLFVDYLARFESINEDWCTIAERIDAPRRLPHANKSEHRPYREYYTPELRTRVADHYRDDLDLLGYEF